MLVTAGAETQPSGIRIFQIGFNKCGTSTLTRFFEQNGVPSMHWNRGRLAMAMFENGAAGRPLISGFEANCFFGDMEVLTNTDYLAAYKLFPILAEENPTALFLLNTRNRREWINSRR